MTPDRGSGRGGFTLLEIIVALVVVEVMLAGAVVTLQMGLRRARQAEIIERVTWEVMTLADSLVDAGPESGRQARPWGELSWEGGVIQAVDSTGARLLRVETVRMP